LGYFQTIDFLGEKYAWQGLASYYAHPKSMKREIFEKSAFMRNRMKMFDRDINDTLRTLTENTPLQKMQRFMFAHIGFMDMMVSLPTWNGGYQKALDEGKSEADAIAYADQAVRMSQSSGGAKDLATIQSGTELNKMFTMFYSYFNLLNNLMRRRAKMTGRNVSPSSVRRASV
jgi:hypothetical protein